MGIGASALDIESQSRPLSALLTTTVVKEKNGLPTWSALRAIERAGRDLAFPRGIRDINRRP